MGQQIKEGSVEVVQARNSNSSSRGGGREVGFMIGHVKIDMKYSLPVWASEI